MQSKKGFWNRKTVMLTLILILAVASGVKAYQVITSNTINIPVETYHVTLYSNYTAGTLTWSDSAVFNATLLHGTTPVYPATVKLYMNNTEINSAPTDNLGKALFPGSYVFTFAGDDRSFFNFTAAYQTP